MTSVLHVVPWLSAGGASRSLLTVAGASSQSHEIASLRPADPRMLKVASDAGVAVIEEPEHAVLAAAMERADVVQVDYWNSPEIGELLSSPLPPTRMAIWCHVGGRDAPQALTPELIAFPDAFVASTPLTGEPLVIPDIADPARVEGVERAEHEGYVVGYVGTVDPAKMHGEFADLCAAVEVPDARFVVCGTGDGFAAIAARAEELGARDRFDLRGYVREVGPVLAELDVFGYPLCRGNYGATELVLQEAMLAGIPPVVLPHGGAGTVVDDGETGIVAADEGAYVQALERLGHDAGLRRRLGDGAREHARRAWAPASVAASWGEVYDELMASPRRSRSPLPAPASGAERFLTGLGEGAAAFRASLQPVDLDAALAADAEVAGAPPVVVNADGGLLDFRRRHPGDPHLRLWSGLALRAQGRNALAAGELAAAIRLGCDPRRAAPALAAAGDELGHPEVASRAREAAAAAGA